METKERMETREYSCGIFDLDGVLVDTARYHYLAWRELAGSLGFEFTRAQNEALKGVSRMKSLELLLESGGMAGRFTQEEKLGLADRKNQIYVEYIKKLEREQLFPGVTETFQRMKEAGVKIALGSASRNAGMILERLDIKPYFDVVVDGNMVHKAKPDPEVFLLAAQTLGIPASECVVFEDSAAGLEAARRAGMLAVGIGEAENLPMADLILENVAEFSWGKFPGSTR